MKISISAATDIGHGRDNNEDAFCVCSNLRKAKWRVKHTPGYIDLDSAGAILVIADGMGGANAGEVASAIAIDTVRKVFSPKEIRDIFRQTEVGRLVDDEQARYMLEKAISQADDAINKRIIEHPETAGMGTTIVVLWLTPERAFVAWCGDSRCYVCDDYELRPLTKDHSYVQELIDKGELTYDEARNHPDSNIITRGLGDFPTKARPDFKSWTVRPGLSFLLCTDGLCGYCTNSFIEEYVIDTRLEPTECTSILIQKALEKGSEDNICVALATVLSDDDENAKKQSRMRRILNFFFK